jgi:hypothetical protein
MLLAVPSVDIHIETFINRTTRYEISQPLVRAFDREWAGCPYKPFVPVVTNFGGAKQ